jgi:hypothetical protein
MVSIGSTMKWKNMHFFTENTNTVLKEEYYRENRILLIDPIVKNIAICMSIQHGWSGSISS